MTNKPETPPDSNEDIGFLIDRSLADSEIELNAIAKIDHVLGHPERICVPAGKIILTEGVPVDGIYLILSGRVRLTRLVDNEVRIFHARTAGRILGLMSLAEGACAFFTCRAETNAELIHISHQRLFEGLHSSLELSTSFVTLFLRSLSRRNLRATEMQVDINRLNRNLARERDQLSHTLNLLKNAQMRLVEAEKMATLGQLVAGIGHEMNNPVAAISRAASFVAEDLRALAGDHPNGQLFLELLNNAVAAAPKSTREQRKQRAALEKQLGHPELARRLVKIGIGSVEELPLSIRSIAPEDLLAQMEKLERFHNLGSSLRSIGTCSERIASLVAGLRSYSRAGTLVEDDVDVASGLEETLLIFGHALRKSTVEKIYKPVPLIACRPGEINQVWTNLISNAIQAMHGDGTLRVELEPEGADGIVVRIIDSGSGIAPENLERIFDLNFTTRQGRVDYGLGLGLAICKDIVHRHGGRIGVESRPGRTVFSVHLPVRLDLEEGLISAEEATP